MKAIITIELDVRQWIEENDITFIEARDTIISELNNDSDEYVFGSFYESTIKVEIN